MTFPLAFVIFVVKETKRKDAIIKVKKYIALILAAALSLSLCACGASETESAEAPSETPAVLAADENRVAPAAFEPAPAFSGGTGTEDDPYQIATAEELARLSLVLSYEYYNEHFSEWQSFQKASYVLTADIVLNDTASYDTWSEKAPTYGWCPIGEDVSGFKGHFDGQGYSVSGVYIYAYEEDMEYAGLFGLIGTGATVENVTVENAYIAAVNAQYAGVLAGKIADTDETIRVENITASGMIADETPSYSTYIGGIAGEVYGFCTVSGCSFAGTLKNAQDMGGIAGVADCTMIRDCSVKGEIIGTDGAYCGGIVGHLSPWNGATTVTGCTNYMEMTQVMGLGSRAGGIVGMATLCQWSDLEGEGTLSDQEWVYGDDDITIANCINEAPVGDGSNDYAGGIVGSISCFNSGSSDITVSDCKNNGKIQASLYAGGIVSDISTGPEGSAAVEGCENTGDVTCLSYAGGIAGYHIPGSTSCYITNCCNSGRTEGGVSAGGILGQVFLFSVLVDTANMEPLFVQQCRNDGEVLTTDGISGVGGIVGSIAPVAEAITYLLVEDCANTHDLYAIGSGRVGGILGTAAMTFLSEDAGTDTPLYVIRNCANTANIYIQDVKSASVQESDYEEDEDAGLTAELEEELDDDMEAINATFLILGGNALGGIVGYHKYGMIEDCVFSGNIEYGDGVTLLTDAEDMQDAASDPDSTGDNAIISGGGLCGTYFYLSTSKCTAENTGVRNSVYNEEVSVPFASFFDPEDSVSGVTAVSAEEAASHAAVIVDALN